MAVINTDNQRVRTSERIAKILSGTSVEHNICPIKDILATIVDKWSIHTILLLGQHGTLRFNQLKTGVRGISQRMLTVTLRSLEEDGVIVRTQYLEIPPRVEYELTVLGNSLLDKLLELACWADLNFREIIRSRSRYAKKEKN